MYAWKCWRDSRLRFVAYLTLVVALPINPTLSPAFRLTDKGWTLLRDSSPVFTNALVESALHAFAGFGLVLFALAGIAMGASGVGDEYKPGSLEYLLTRPRQRRHFVWVGWLVGVIEMLAMTSVSAAVIFSLVFYLSRGTALWRLVALVPLMLVMALVFFGLAYLGTVITREGKNGLAFAVLATLAYLIVSFLLQREWGIELPSFIGLLRPVVDGGKPFAFGLLAFWTAFALACPLAAQWIFERRDI